MDPMAAPHPRPLGVLHPKLPQIRPARLPRYPLQTILRQVLNNIVSMRGAPVKVLQRAPLFARGKAMWSYAKANSLFEKSFSDRRRLAARRARALGIGVLSGGYGQEELEPAGAYRGYEDPADLLRHIDEVCGRQ
jgi:hypothetical protein